MGGVDGRCGGLVWRAGVEGSVRAGVRGQRAWVWFTASS